MDPISSMFYRNFTITNGNSVYPNALELQIGSWITYGLRLELIDKADDMPNHRVNVNCSSTAPMEGLSNDDGLEFSKTAQSLRLLGETVTGSETLEYLNMDLDTRTSGTKS